MKSVKSIVTFLIITFILILSITLIAHYSSNDSISSTIPLVSATPETTQNYTLAQVATHKDTTSCWTVIRTGVYDLTAWINQHPGGKESIIGLCGKDGTAFFEAQHGGQGNPEATLKKLKIGNYKVN